MHIQVDFRSGVPIYLQIVDQIKRLIAIGELQHGDQLPTVRQLAADLDVNFNTIARAYRLLDEDGIISTQHGRGTYILKTVPNGDTGPIRQELLESLAQQYIIEAEYLGFSEPEILQALYDYFDRNRGTHENHPES